LNPIVVGDLFCFNAINLTSGATQDSHLIVGGAVIFQAQGSGQAATSPLSETALQISLLGNAAGLGPNGLGSGPYPYWAPVVPLNQITQAGNFQVIVSLTVQGSDGSGGTMTKTFVVDPEMIVSGL